MPTGSGALGLLICPSSVVVVVVVVRQLLLHRALTENLFSNFCCNSAHTLLMTIAISCIDEVLIESLKVAEICLFWPKLGPFHIKWIISQQLLSNYFSNLAYKFLMTIVTP